MIKYNFRSTTLFYVVHSTHIFPWCILLMDMDIHSHSINQIAFWHPKLVCTNEHIFINITILFSKYFRKLFIKLNSDIKHIVKICLLF